MSNEIDIGKVIHLTYLAERIPVTVNQIERYSDAVILGYLVHKSGLQAIATVFPDYPYLPPFTTNELFYYPPTAYFDTGEHIWVAPIGKRLDRKSRETTHLITGDPIQFAKAKIDYIHKLVKEISGMVDDMEIVPGTDRELRQWRRWWQR